MLTPSLDPPSAAPPHTGIALHADPVCHRCAVGPLHTTPVQCHLCHTAWYCSSACRTAHAADHADMCNRVANARAKEHALAAPLLHDDVFAVEPGNFWYLPRTRAYCLARANLALVLEHAARAYPSGCILREALSHRLELMRLCVADLVDMKFAVPFTLLRLCQDRHCYAFVKFWLREMFDPAVKDYQVYDNSHQGDWVYGTADDPHEDIYTLLNCSTAAVPLPFTVALLITKLRLAAEYRAEAHSLWRIFAATNTCDRLGDCADLVRTHFLQSAPATVEANRQTQLARKYLSIVNEKNPTMLPCILNPGPMLGTLGPTLVTDGSPAEAYCVLVNCDGLVAQIPGARKEIERLVGRDPEYDYTENMTVPLDQLHLVEDGEDFNPYLGH